MIIVLWISPIKSESLTDLYHKRIYTRNFHDRYHQYHQSVYNYNFRDRHQNIYISGPSSYIISKTIQKVQKQSISSLTKSATKLKQKLAVEITEDDIKLMSKKKNTKSYVINIIVIKVWVRFYLKLSRSLSPVSPKRI